MKIGDKVVPVKKSVGIFDLDKCREWDIGKEQGYLYIVGKHIKGYMLSAFNCRYNGSLYGFDDVVPFNEKDDKYFNEIKKGTYIKDLEVDIEWHKNEQFLNALDNNEDLLCISCMDKNFVYTLNLVQIKKLYNYLGKVLNYCHTIE